MAWGLRRWSPGLSSQGALRRPHLQIHALDVERDRDAVESVRALHGPDRDDADVDELEPLPTSTFVEVVAQLAEVLERIHAAHLVHCDIHPGNVLVDPSTLRVHLLDLGVAHRLGTFSRQRSGDSVSETVRGTLSYIAPEQTGRMNRGVDSRSDLYGLGATRPSTALSTVRWAGSPS